MTCTHWCCRQAGRREWTTTAKPPGWPPTSPATRVCGRRRGIVFIASAVELPPDTEARLADFTELVGTAVGNAQSRAELDASRTRIVAAADQTRRRIERDLHDGVQQRLG